MNEATKKFVLSSALIGGGIGLVTWGLRPKSTREKAAEQISSWRPEQVSYSAAQHAKINEVRDAMNQLRAQIRNVWTSTSSGVDIHQTANFAASFANDELPWRVQKIGSATLDVGLGREAYQTDMIAPQLHSALARLDVALHEGKIADWPTMVSTKQALSTIRGLSRAQIDALAATCSKQFGTYIPALAAHYYDVLSAKAMAQETKDNMPGVNAVQTALAWVALNAPLISDLTKEERKTQRALRKSTARQPRILVP